jgi:hypothetical protein
MLAEPQWSKLSGIVEADEMYVGGRKKPVESGALAARSTRKGKGLRRNSARRSGNMEEPQDLVSCGSTP